MATTKASAPTIWCLFSVDNNYDQPDRNLTAWWQTKPSIEKLAGFLTVKLGECDDQTVKLVKIWSGEQHTLGILNDAAYRLEEVAEGGVC